MASVINANTSSGVTTTADTSGILQLQTASVTAVTIDASQNVNINTTSTFGKFNVKQSNEGAGTNAASGLTVQRSANDSYLGIQYQTTPDAWAISSSYSSTGAYKPLIFETSDLERMRINSSGNVGIGTTSPTNTLQVAGGISATGSAPAFQASAAIIDVSGGVARINATGADNSTNGTMTFNTASANAGVFNERMRIDSSGNVLVQTSNAAFNAGTGIKLIPDASGPAVVCVGSATTASFNTYFVYSTGASANRFYVSYAGQIYATSTSISGISDISLKENIKDLETGLNEVMALKPRRFDWKNGDATNVAGFVAQEVEEVLPELVTEYQYNETETKKALKMGDILPTLVKAIQEQQALITDLTTRLAALEGAK